MSNPKRYLSDAARMRDERRRSLLNELEKLKKEDDEEERQRERERSRIRELEEDRKRSVQMRDNIWKRKKEIGVQIKHLQIEDEDLLEKDKKLVERLDWLNKEIKCLNEGKEYEYPKCLPKLIPKMEELKEARKKINEENEKKEQEEKEKDRIISEIFSEIKYEKDKDNVESEEEEEEEGEPEQKEAKKEEGEPEPEEAKKIDFVTKAINDIKETEDEEIKKKIELETNEKLQKMYEEGVDKGDKEMQELAFLRMRRFEKRDAFPITENDFEDKEKEEELAEKLKI